MGRLSPIFNCIYFSFSIFLLTLEYFFRNDLLRGKKSRRWLSIIFMWQKERKCSKRNGACQRGSSSMHAGDLLGLDFQREKNQRSIEGQYRQRDKLMYATGHRLHGKLRVSIPGWCEWRQALGLVSVTDLMWTCPREVPYLGVWKLLSVEDTSRGSINYEFSHIILCYLGRDS